MSAPFSWESIATQWRVAFAQPEVDRFLDEQLVVLLSPTASLEQRSAARGAIDTVLRLQSLPEMARAKEKKTPPLVEPALSWRPRLLQILREQYPKE